MNNAGELFVNALEQWNTNKGIGTAFITPPLNDKVMILAVLQKVYIKRPNLDTTIIVPSFKDRMDIIEFITQQEEEENNAEFKKLISDKRIKIITIDLLKKFNYNSGSTLVIVYKPEDVCDNLKRILLSSKFKLVIINKIMTNTSDMATLYSLVPLLDGFKESEIASLRMSSPVEDMWVDVTIPEDSEDYKLLNYYNDYIAASISIFGSFDIIKQARTGNPALNISANQICNQLAESNGWNECLDMSIELNVELDKLYNPGAIKDRASRTYEIIRERANLLTDYEGKIEQICNIVQKHENENILIISKRGLFASKITDAINKMEGSIICGNYHDRMEPIPAIDTNGNPITYKSGLKKGEPKMLAVQAQRTRNQSLFDNGEIRIISTSNAPDKALHGRFDVIIITSPLCESIKSYMYRLDNITFGDKILLYSIYIKNSLEEQRLQNKDLADNHSIVNKCESVVISENNSDFIVVD